MIPFGRHDVSRLTRSIGKPGTRDRNGDEMKRTNPLGLVVIGAATAVLLAACGSGATTSGAVPAPQSSSASLTATMSANFGTIVLDQHGRAVYRYDKDTTNPSVSNCTGSCAQIWPPVLAGDGAVQLQGVNRSAVGTITRPDGSEQLTLGGSPLYEFASDTAPGDVKGQAIDGTFWAVTPTGAKDMMMPRPTDDHGDGSGGSSGSGGPGGYGN
jgi:predicted lipoprotein with Yx(FWY)xxD motif